MMDYNNYYPVQTGPPPLPPPSMMNNQPDYSMMGGPMTPNSFMHSTPAPPTPQSMRHTTGPASMQHHHSMSHHQQQQQLSPHANYHQLPPHPPMSHSASPNPSSTPHSQGQPSPRPAYSMSHHQQQQQLSPHPNYHQLPQHPPMSHSASPHHSSTPHSQGQPSPRPATGPSPLHHQMSPHVNRQSPKITQSGPMHSSVMSSSNHHHNHHHHQSGPPHAPPHAPPHGHSYSNNPMPQHYGQPKKNVQAPLGPPSMNNVPQPNPNSHMKSSPPSPHPSTYMPHPNNQGKGPQNMPQTELRLMELNKRLQSRPTVSRPSSPLPNSGSYEQSAWWERFACDFFDNDATLTIRIPGETQPIEYNIDRAMIPRFFKSYFDGGVTDLSFKLRNIRETQHHPNLTTMDCDQADIVTKNAFKHAMGMYMFVVYTEGHLSLDFVNNNVDNLVIKSWRFNVSQCHEYVDRSVTNTAIPHLSEPVTRFGLTKSTCAYLKMCLVMKPMQDIMSMHKQSNLDPRTCLKNLLYERYNFKNEDKVTAQPQKRRKRKPAEPGAATNKKSKPGANVVNNPHMTESDPQPSLPLATLDVLVVGEPMLGADFSDENERRITRLENDEYDSPTDQGGQQSGILNDSNQMNQICMSNTSMSQEQQCDMTSHLTQGSQYDSESILGVHPPNSDHTEDSIDSQRSKIKHEMNEPNVAVANNNDDNCSQGNNDLTSVEDTRDDNNDKISPPLGDDSSRPASEEPSEKENNGTPVNEEIPNGVQVRSHLSTLNRIPEDSVQCSDMSSLDANSRLAPSVNMVVVPTNGCQTASTKQNRRRSSERKETLREGLMRTNDFVIKTEDLKNEHPLMWKISGTGNSLLQRFEPTEKNGVVLYENTYQFHGWNDDIRRECVGVDVKLTQHKRDQITVERLLLNFQKLDDPETFYDRHFLIYLQILISTALDPKFWEGIESDPENRDYFLTSRKIIDDIIKRHKAKLANKLKLSEVTIKNFEKYPNLLIVPINSDNKGQSPPCRACNTISSTQNVSFGDRSYDLHSYKPVKVTSELTTHDNKDSHEITLCDSCMITVKLYSEVHHLGWRLLNATVERIEQLRSKGKSANAIVDEFLTDEDWINKNYSERDSLWSRIDQICKQGPNSSSMLIIEERRLS